MADTDTRLHFLTIRDASELLQRRELSPVELTRAFLDRIDATDGQLHSFITLLREESLEQARTAVGTRLASTLEPAVVLMPAVSYRSFKAMGMPWRGPL